ncbi:MAG: coenzyme F420-0:L-glutamate ligase [Archaeoglobaceae archaeon]
MQREVEEEEKRSLKEHSQCSRAEKKSLVSSLSILQGKKVEVIPVLGLPIITKGDNIAKLIMEKAEVRDGDIVVICSTIVSKSEGRVRNLSDYKPGPLAFELSKKVSKPPEFIQAVIEESEEILINEPFLLVKAKYGNICVNAGIDTSNIDKGKILLPPLDPDKSAEKIRVEFEKLGRKVGVIVTDTNGRCFRKGVVGIAMGVSGVCVMRDWRGEKDLYGNVLEVTVECVADEIAAFANLIMGEAGDGIPAVIIRGLKLLGKGTSREIIRGEEEDVIRRCLKKCF